jgi:hypothetical protein
MSLAQLAFLEMLWGFTKVAFRIPFISTMTIIVISVIFGYKKNSRFCFSNNIQKKIWLTARSFTNLKVFLVEKTMGFYFF